MKERDLLRRVLAEGTYFGGGPFDVKCLRCGRTKEDGHGDGCLTGDIEEVLMDERKEVTERIEEDKKRLPGAVGDATSAGFDHGEQLANWLREEAKVRTHGSACCNAIGTAHHPDCPERLRATLGEKGRVYGSAPLQRRLYVWPKRGFLACAYAASTAEARELLLKEINSDGSDGSLPAVTRAVEAIKAHAPQVFAYSSTAEFVLTSSGQLEAEEKALADVLRAAENLYAFAEAFGSEILTDEGKRQVSAAYLVLRANGSSMHPPPWGASGDAMCAAGDHFVLNGRCTACGAKE